MPVGRGAPDLRWAGVTTRVLVRFWTWPRADDCPVLTCTDRRSGRNVWVTDSTGEVATIPDREATPAKQDWTGDHGGTGPVSLRWATVTLVSGMTSLVVPRTDAGSEQMFGGSSARRAATRTQLVSLKPRIRKKMAPPGTG